MDKLKVLQKIDDLSRVADHELKRPECTEILSYIKSLQSLDDSALEKTAKKYLPPSLVGTKTYSHEMFISDIKSVEFSCNYFAHCTMLLIENLSLLIARELGDKYKGEERFKRRNAIYRIRIALELKLRVAELKKQLDLSLDADHLFNMYNIGKLEAMLGHIKDLHSENLQKTLHSIVSARIVEKGRWESHPHKKLLQEALEIAERHYESGRRKLHNELGGDIYWEFYERFKKKSPRLQKPVLEKEFPGKTKIMKTIKPVARKYNCVRGDKGAIKQ